MKKIIFILVVIVVFNLKNSISQSYSSDYHKNVEKITQVLQYMKFVYVDTISLNKYIEKGIAEMFKELDPHSVYISKEEVEKTNEPLVGNFEGVGIQFQIIKDTIYVVGVINGGPSEQVGIMNGDKFIKVDTSIATGSKIDSKWVFDHLRGKKGTKVKMVMKRKGVKDLLEFTVARDKIPITSIDCFFMADKEIGYIKLDRFAQTSMEELKKAMSDLKNRGMKHLIFDLRGNGGGYLGVAVQLADEFLDKSKLIVYTEGAASPKQTYNAKNKGAFEKGKLIILIDEGSASASEIVSGAIQDWDRGIIMGRRSFGKGLVQKSLELNDKSMIRLTTSRYYTPTGRSIQKPYDDGLDDYYKDLAKRYQHGEYVNKDSIKFPDSLKYYTNSNRVVYGGGGIMPDIFIPLDTNRVNSFYSSLNRQGIFNNYVMAIIDNKKSELLKQYPNFESFNKNFVIDEKIFNDFIKYANNEGVSDTVNFVFTDFMKSFIENSNDTLNKTFNSINTLDNNKMNYDFNKTFEEFVKQEINKNQNPKVKSETDKYIKYQLKFVFARYLYDFSSALQYWTKEVDETYKKAYEVIKNDKLFKEMNVSY